MGIFTKHQTFFEDPKLIPSIVEELEIRFKNDGYHVQKTELLSGETVLFIKKEGWLRIIFGLQKRCRIKLRQENGRIFAECGFTFLECFLARLLLFIVGVVFVLPFLLILAGIGIAREIMFFGKPLSFIEVSITRLKNQPVTTIQTKEVSFCPECGSKTNRGEFCPQCGTKHNA